MNHPSPWQAYLPVRKGRFRKKKAVYKTLVALSFDIITIIYSIIVGGYVFASIFIFNDFFKVFQDEFQFVETQLNERFWLILSIVPLRYIFQSFRNPGITITSSEYQLGMLPYSIKRIAFFVAIEKWIKLLLKYLVVIAIAMLITPIDPKIISLYFILFWVIEVLMTVPQWKLFQTNFMVKLTLLLSLGMLTMVGTFTHTSPIVGIGVFIAMIACNFLLANRLFDNINWGRVIEVNDYIIWSMPIVSKATKVKFKRQKRFNLFQNRASRKKPFTYTNSAIHKRLWLQYYRENIEFIVKVVGGLLLTNTILPFIHPTVALIGIALSIFVYTTFVSSLFVDRFYTGIVQVLPWDVKSFRITKRKWVLIGFIPILIPITVYSIVHFSWWSIGFFLLIFSVFIINYEVKMDTASERLNKRLSQLTLKGTIAFCSLGLIVLCAYNIYFTLVSVVLLTYVIYQIIIPSQKKHDV
ncbi:hypothetical protein [Ornithinibacillus californiensis]|uniref:hypothetical protein n=1 Tax=Ornithinibacillus californiensis TaxID=161536 RepID=UPI00064D8F8C|nr:hypothetical protein [Ornithinibacillus californiensis]